MLSDTFNHLSQSTPRPQRHRTQNSRRIARGLLQRTNVLTVLAVAFIFATLPTRASAQHNEHNPVFTTLVNQGIKTDDGKTHALPKPIMADGLSADEQVAVIKSQLGGKPMDGYLRNSVMAPHICKLTCLLYTSPSPRDATLSRMPSSA